MSRLLRSVFCVLGMIMSLNLVFAEVPYKFNYQGRLRQSGQPVSGARVFQFKIYSALTGGTALWTSSSYSVNVATGVYSVVLNLPETLDYSSGSYYLEIMVGEGAPSVTLSPREQLTSTVYSIYSNDTDNLDGRDYTAFVSTRAESQTIAGAKTFTDTLILQGNVGIGVSPSKKLDVAGEVRSTVGGVEFYMVPKGTIIMWPGTLAAIPAGWQLCDGTNGTPDLRNKFIYGVATGENPGAAGGATSHSHTYTTVIAHSHSVSDPGHKHWVSSAQRDDGNGTGCMTNGQMFGLWADASSYTADDPSYGAGRYNRAVGTGISITSTGSASGTTSAPTVLPPYMKLAFIMKM